MDEVEATVGAGGESEGAAFERTFEDNYAAVLAFARRRVDGREAADDIVAETFAVAWRRRDALPERARPWLFGVARKLIANQHRANRRDRSLLDRLGGGSAATGQDPAVLVGEREAVGRAFAHLSDREREILTLVAWEQLEARDAARALGCSAAAFRVRLHRARRAFERYLAEAETSDDLTRPLQGGIEPLDQSTKEEPRCATE